MSKVNFVVLHGYNASHGSGFERVLSNEFSDKYDFCCLNLLGHEADRSEPVLYPLGDVISDAIDKIKKWSDTDSVLAGSSFGAYPVLECLRRGLDVAGFALVKPMTSLEHTFNFPNSDLERHRDVLRPEMAIDIYRYGKEDRPFVVGGPGLVFGGTEDFIIGDVDFVKKRIKGERVEYLKLEGGHSDYKEEDAVRVVKGVNSLLDRV